jgi:microsomal dipeptidase-like Zn-dependent dipeptidase
VAKSNFHTSRRRVLKLLSTGAFVLSTKAWGQTSPVTSPSVLMDGHVHAINRVYWEKADLWQPVPDVGWDFARARAGGVNCVIDNLGTYGYWNYNYTPKQALRLFETAHRFAEEHADKMGIALSVADARRIVASGRMAVFLGSESGWDHEGDLDVLGAFYRLGLRTIQFATQSGFNAFSDSALAMAQGGQAPDHYHGINDRGRALVAEMNRLGVLIDITHGTEAVHMQLIEASRAPVVASHETIRSVSGVGLSEQVLKALANKGGLVAIHGSAAVVSKRFRKWMIDHPDEMAAAPNYCPTCWAINRASRARQAIMASTSTDSTRNSKRRGEHAVAGRKFLNWCRSFQPPTNGRSMSTTSSRPSVRIMSLSASTCSAAAAPFRRMPAAIPT